MSRAETVASGEKIKLAGARRIICPNAIGARRMALSALQPMMVDFMDALAVGRHGDLLIAELEVEESSALDGCKLADAFAEATDTTVLGIRRIDKSFLLGPRGGADLRAGDVVIVMASEEDISHLAERSRAGEPNI